MHLFVKTLYMVTVMVMTGMMMVLVLICTPDIHSRLSTSLYRQSDLSYSQFVLQSLDSPGVYVAEVSIDTPFDIAPNTQVKREVPWDYMGNNTGHLKIHLDYARPQHQPWAGQTQCMDLRVGFARRRTLPRTALASFPGSGNTWLRYMIQGATGLFTGSVYIDRQLASKGFYGENETPECGCTIVVKTHGYCLGGLPESSNARYKELEKFHGRGILLLRNPYDSLISYRNFLSGGHLGVAGPVAFRGADWARFVRSQMELWQAYATDWITRSRSILVIHYEHLLEDPQNQLLKILHFLRVKVDPHRLECVIGNLHGNFKRITPNGISYRLRDPFTEELHEVVEAAMMEVDAILGQRDWPRLPTNLYSYHHQRNNTTKHNPIGESYNESNSAVSNSRKDRRKQEYDLGNNKRKVFSAMRRKAVNSTNSIKKSKGSKPRLRDLDSSKVIHLKPWMKPR